MATDLYKHICESCGREEILTSKEGFNAGWDYPPAMGAFGVVSPRTCPDCNIMQTLWWKLTQGGVTLEDLSEKELATLERINDEPQSILVALEP